MRSGGQQLPNRFQSPGQVRPSLWICAGGRIKSQWVAQKCLPVVDFKSVGGSVNIEHGQQCAMFCPGQKPKHTPNTPQTPPNKTPNTSQSHPKNTTQTPKTARGKTPNTSQTPPNKTPNTSTGAEIQTTNNRQQTTDKTNKADSYSEVRKLWSDLNQIRSDLDSEAVPIKLTSTRKRTLKARLKENPPSDILAVFKWWLQSPHKRAKYLRDNDYGVSTVLKADNFESYLELSRQPSKPKRARLSRNGTLLSSAASSTKDPHKAWSERHQRAAK